MALGFGQKNVGIDLGTSNTLVFLEGSGVIINEPSFVAKDTATSELMAVGSAAHKMFEKNPPTISVIRPLRKGVISDLDATIGLLNYFLNVAYNNHPGKPVAIIGVPSGVTEVERRAVKDAAQSAGVKDAYIIDEPIAAAVGAGLPVYDAPGTMVVDLGGGTVDIATISLGKANATRSTVYAGDAMNDAIKDMVLQRYNFRISEGDAQILKEEIGSANVKASKQLGSATVKGIDLISGLPAQRDVTAEDVALAIASPVNHILTEIQTTLEESLPELVSDIIDRGITLTGGGANLRFLDRAIADTVHVPAFIAPNPQEAVVNGLGEMLRSSQLRFKE
ncbi:rod shape-determining protein [Oenococcus oeni]|uniref:rod shape-determining protein n=1 Tax=Oenococcus oeni TaxID=1247 RepID=UPI00050E9861|nr:rod shape-determining protein [Oenococcus oeni]KGH82464.1 rod shape-determining protein Mbl [Oenococcus oeni S14]